VGERLVRRLVRDRAAEVEAGDRLRARRDVQVGEDARCQALQLQPGLLVEELPHGLLARVARAREERVEWDSQPGGDRLERGLDGACLAGFELVQRLPADDALGDLRQGQPGVQAGLPEGSGIDGLATGEAPS
jgi:hypothetical protein